MIGTKFFSATSLLFLAGLSSGCVDFGFKTSKIRSSPTHLAVLPPPSLKSGRELILFVGLEPYLGRISKNQEFSSNELHLVSAGRPLLLKDRNGFEHSALEIKVSWKKVPLKPVRTISRQVVGPFSSFESAERVANGLRIKGLEALVAHPKEWEVWLPAGSKLPIDIKAIATKKRLISESRAFLKIGSKEHFLVGPIQIDALDGLKFRDGVYKGPFRLQRDAYGSWTLVEEVPLESYLKGVVPYEIGSGSPPAALRAQAVLARTWALANAHRFLIDGYHLCSDTQCQVYKNPRNANEEVRRAIAGTAGKILSWQNKPIHAVYHASNGGVIAAGTEAWSMNKVPYLKARLDGSKDLFKKFDLPFKNNFEINAFLKQSKEIYGSNHPRFRWIRTFSAIELQKSLPEFKAANILPKSVSVLERGPSGRVIVLEIADSSNELRKVLRLDQIRSKLSKLPSTLFVVNELQEGFWQFSGGGFGHGAGLSQAGAIDLSLRGWNTSDILRHYYPGTIYGSLPVFTKKAP